VSCDDSRKQVSCGDGWFSPCPPSPRPCTATRPLESVIFRACYTPIARNVEVAL
jgi:hypothetical protein